MGKLRRQNLERFSEKLANDPELDKAYRETFKEGFDETIDHFKHFIKGGRNQGQLVGVVVALHCIADEIYDECRQARFTSFPAAVDFFTAEMKQEDNDDRSDL